VKPYYQDDWVTLYHGDALDVLPSTPSATCVALDPPYSMVPNSFAGQDDGAAGSSAAPVRLLTETLRETRRLLPDGGTAGLICDWRRLPDVAYLATLVGLRISTCVAWTRNSPGLGGMFRSAWDPMLVLSVGSPDIRDKAAARNVINVEKPRGSEHPYEKPVALWQYLFDRLPHGLVVDPFAGTGASGIAAKAAGHRWVGIEVDERYCEIAAIRCSQEVLGLETA
jgi:site-specific DNA-methyltransferase (adenine-specific)